MDRPEFLCVDCDWVGSPDPSPSECPGCGGTLEEITPADKALKDEDEE